MAETVDCEVLSRILESWMVKRMYSACGYWLCHCQSASLV